MLILAREQISPEVLKITSDTGSAFFIRTNYLVSVKAEEITESVEFSGLFEEDIIDAGLAYSVEIKALDYLSRCEQNRSGLTKKLLNKGFENKYIEKALDYLEEKKYLSDERFARAWLNSRKINHSEGRTKLAAELAARGIKKETASTALKDFFDENSEIELCKKDFIKISRTTCDREKIIRRLIAHGFSYSMIKKVISESDL